MAWVWSQPAAPHSAATSAQLVTQDIKQFLEELVLPSTLNNFVNPVLHSNFNRFLGPRLTSPRPTLAPTRGP